MSRWSTAFLAILLSICLGRADTFQNLDFDSPILDRLRTEPGGARFGPVEDLLRGWDVSLRYDPQVWEHYSGDVDFQLGGIFTPVGLVTDSSFGTYGIAITSPQNTQPNQPLPPEIRVSTTGIVPLNAESFEWRHFGGTLIVEVDGQRWDTIVGTQNLMDVRQLAGKQITLHFDVVSGGQTWLDVVGFKPIPEPSTWALVGVGGMALLWLGKGRTG